MLSLLLITLFFNGALSQGVLGVDFGTMSFKQALITPGTFDMVLNEQSGRATPTALAYDRSERFFGKQAADLAMKKPSQAWPFLPRLAGLSYEEAAALQGSVYHPYEIVNVSGRAGIHLCDEEPELLVDTALGSIFRYASGLVADANEGTFVRDAVIVVRPQASHAERATIESALRMADYSPLGFISSTMAGAINFASKRKLDGDGEDEATFDRLFAVYDMGATRTSATIVRFSSTTEERGKFKKTNVTVGVVEALGHGWDDNLGGMDFDTRIATTLRERAIAEATKAGIEDAEHRLRTGTKAFARLMKEAKKTKHVLSTLPETTSIIESLLPDFDFQSPVTRADLSEWCADLLDRASKPLEAAVRAATDAALAEGEDPIDLADLDGVEIIGGGSRVRAVQERLEATLTEGGCTADPLLQRHIDGDEGAVFGAVFYGALLSRGFRVKELKVKDSIPHGGSAVISYYQETDEEETPTTRDVVLFKPNARVRAKKTLSLRTAKSINATLAYDDGQPFAQCFVTGVPKSGVVHNLTDATPKCAVSFAVNNLGNLEVTSAKVEAAEWKVKHFPKPKPVSPPPPPPPPAAAKGEGEGDEAEGAEGEEEEAAPAVDESLHIVSADDESVASLGLPHLGGVEDVVESYMKQDWSIFTVTHLAVTKDGVPIVPGAEGEGEGDEEGASSSFYERFMGVFRGASGDEEVIAYVRAQVGDEESVRFLDARLRVDSDKVASVAADEEAIEAEADADADVDAESESDADVDVDADVETEDEGPGAAAPPDVEGAAEEEEQSRSFVCEGAVLHPAADEAEDDADALGPLDRVPVTPAPPPPPVWREVPLKKSLIVDCVPVPGAPAALTSLERLEQQVILDRLDKLDEDRARVAELRNSLETLVYTMKERLYDEDVETVTTEESRDSLREQLSEHSDWLYEDEAEDASLDTVQARVDLVNEMMEPVLTRARDFAQGAEEAEKARDGLVAADEMLLNLTKARNLTDDDIENATATIAAVRDWLTEAEEAQAALDPVTDEPTLALAEIESRMTDVSRLLKRLARKPKKRSAKKATKGKGKGAKDAPNFSQEELEELLEKAKAGAGEDDEVRRMAEEFAAARAAEKAAKEAAAGEGEGAKDEL
jgi:molecular chaperone DnaK (HSP70)